MNRTCIKYKDIQECCEELHKLALDMNEVIENINNIGTKMKNLNIWNGPASENYQSKLTKLCSNFSNNYEEIENAVLFLTKCSADYDQIEKDLSNEIMKAINITNINDINSKYFGGV